MREDQLILAKSLALIEKTFERVSQIDSTTFPTASSERAHSLLKGVLKALKLRAKEPSVSPEALYSTLIRLQPIVGEVEASSSEHVSWPLVSYCDHVWKTIFPNRNEHLFYSLTAEHNYTISSFSHRIATLLEPVLIKAEIISLIGSEKLYCLQLASLEEENLPLYANIGHEFGHAVYHLHKDGLVALFSKLVISVFTQLITDLDLLDPATMRRRALRMVWVLKSMATELFCDLVGLLVAGPAFALSLQEMAWGSEQSRWTGRLLPVQTYIRCYPSFRFRMSCLQQHASLEQYAKEARKAFQKLDSEALRKLSTLVSELPSDHSKDYVSIAPESDADSDAIQNVLKKNLEGIKACFTSFLEKCFTEFLPGLSWFPQFGAISADDVADLLHRLENDILPNIIPDGSLLGQPATFGAILNASAVFRMHVLKEGSGRPSADLHGDLQKVERLTAKALEVSYIQREFNFKRTSFQSE